MKKSISNSLLLLSGIIILASCHSKKQLVKRQADSSAVRTDNAASAVKNKINAIKSKQVSFTTFSGKAKTKLNVNGNSNDVTMNIRIQKNQKIWVSITAVIGIEVARALITPDSILVINKLQSVYIKKPFSYIYTYASRQVNYKTVESLLVGNAIPELLNENGKLEPSNGNVVIDGQLQDLLYKLIIGPDLKVTSTDLSNQSAGQSLHIDNSAFVQADGRVIPSEIAFSSTVKNKTIQADLKYSKTEFDQPLDFPFSIPSRFSQVN
ncbi:DUF4292 domain-containing protein [Mucilaginibacter sp. KACC 22063]|uniref:DUF4292 domain-containing protein n=1 Tax=Mucilaginibacter sp. KACC 22063 TaxID=3025666 RepID=UPI002365CF26|nr:DUF4292 domain-containing protein [Mucilaginibacter sp. KACC 22063]WDF55933.1 DUF4292 domain-containing protein [Mucilaginibacter sp. KACC 22063]